MNQPFKEKTAGFHRILVVPLDWGLGHATRCIPIIRELLAQNCEVWLAGEGAQEQLLKAEFPDLPFLHLPGYNIDYAKTKRGLVWKMISQVSKINRTIRYEQQWLKQVIDEYKFDTVISDNRYGLYHSSIPCIFITHQLLIKSSVGKWTERLLQKKNYHYINKFSACWIPDFADKDNLAGELSHPSIKPIVPVHYIGLLSRFDKNNPANNDTSAKKDHLLIMLSGPEPQRSIFEEKIIADISHYNGTATIVRGLPGSASLIPSTNMLKFYNHLSADDLLVEMQKAELIIARSGYSSIMDIMALQKKSILIPTPGQTEQEYLGKYLMEKRMAICLAQKDFSLNAALTESGNFDYTFPQFSNDVPLRKTIELFLHQVANPALG